MEIPIKNYDNTDKMQSTQSTDIHAGSFDVYRKRFHDLV